MKKSYRQLLKATILIILYAVLLFFFCKNSMEELTDDTELYSGDVKIIDGQNDGIKPEASIIQYAKRINIVLLGIESDSRADTIMFISYYGKERSLDIISIPRDTYFHEKGYDKGDQRKINSAYGRKKEEGCIEAVRKVLGDTPVDYYISVDYEGVVEIIDAIEGVELEVPLHMEVGGIEIPKGKQVLHGAEALQYLRFRKGYPDGDLGRIKAQQKLVKAALSRIRYMELPQMAINAFKSIRTNMPVKYLIEYARQLKNGEIKEVSTYMLPGAAMYKYIGGYNWSYFFHNPKKVKELLNEIYEVKSIEQKQRKRFKEY